MSFEDTGIEGDPEWDAFRRVGIEEARKEIRPEWGAITRQGFQVFLVERLKKEVARASYSVQTSI